MFGGDGSEGDIAPAQLTKRGLVYPRMADVERRSRGC